ncbi:class F sortase [Nocardioides sp. MJB4]|uniref:Class F sortase n=1 Tax=Nocardioides donggukensis TaxID=2774019 RepID=A0A927K322_9ACTN|nr:class F sortase [Nocardioides donggukensis]
MAVDAPVVPIAAQGEVLVPPADPQVIGWWAAGAAPGASTGTTLVTGHTVSTGGGALDDLEEVRPGDPVTVGTGADTVDYVVRRVEEFSKGELARRAEELFRQDGPGRLAIVTCEDWDGSQYLSNVVVTAVPR